MTERLNRIGVHAITSVNPKIAKDRWCVPLRNSILLDRLELASPQTHRKKGIKKEKTQGINQIPMMRCLGYKYVRSLHIYRDVE